MLGFRGHLAEDGTVGDIGISFGSVAPTVIRLRQTEATVRGARLDADTIHTAVHCAGTEVVPIDDVRSSATYRRRVAQNLVGRYLRQLAETHE